MKLNYYEETDSLHIGLSEGQSANTIEVADGVLVDFDEAGNLVGIDIDNASKITNLSELVNDKLPLACS